MADGNSPTLETSDIVVDVNKESPQTSEDSSVPFLQKVSPNFFLSLQYSFKFLDSNLASCKLLIKSNILLN